MNSAVLAEESVMDSRIGILNSGKFYAYANGYGKPPVVGTLADVEIALGLRKPVKKLRAYIVSVTPKKEFHFNSGVDFIEVQALDANQAIKKVREMCQVSRYDVPNTYRAKLA